MEHEKMVSAKGQIVEGEVTGYTGTGSYCSPLTNTPYGMKIKVDGKIVVNLPRLFSKEIAATQMMLKEMRREVRELEKQ